MSLIRNKKASLNFEILERFVAGIELHGFEVKSLRAHRGKLEGAHVVIRGGEAFLVGADIPAWQVANAPKAYDSLRPRRLLLTKKELAQLIEAEAQKGQTLIALSVFAKGSKLKLEFAIARGKKKYDKRESIKKRDSARDIAREHKVQLRS